MAKAAVSRPFDTITTKSIGKRPVTYVRSPLTVHDLRDEAVCLRIPAHMPTLHRVVRLAPRQAIRGYAHKVPSEGRCDDDVADPLSQEPQNDDLLHRASAPKVLVHWAKVECTLRWINPKNSGLMPIATAVPMPETDLANVRLCTRIPGRVTYARQ